MTYILLYSLHSTEMSFNFYHFLINLPSKDLKKMYSFILITVFFLFCFFVVHNFFPSIFFLFFFFVLTSFSLILCLIAKLSPPFSLPYSPTNPQKQEAIIRRRLNHVSFFCDPRNQHARAHRHKQKHTRLCLPRDVCSPWYAMPRLVEADMSLIIWSMDNKIIREWDEKNEKYKRNIETKRQAAGIL